MEKPPHRPFVPADRDLPELTFRALALGIGMAIVLGAANAYLGMKAGLTVAATFPAAVVAMAVLRIWKGSILEENIARTTGSVGEALVAGAIFTLPAFVISGAWEELHYLQSTAIMLVGGILGVLFIVVLRRTLVVEADLPYPESVAAAEIVKAGQGGQTGAAYVFGAMGAAGLWELFKNVNGIHLILDTAARFVSFGRSSIQVLQQRLDYTGGMLLSSPTVSPALIGVGFIIDFEVSAVLMAGAVLGWLLLVPLALFLNPALAVSLAPGEGMIDLAYAVWASQVRPLAVGTMIVAALHTLWGLRAALTGGIRRAFADIASGVGGAGAERTDRDLDAKKVFIAIAIMAVATFGLYFYFARSVAGALVLAGVMIVVGFLFAAVAGYLVGMIGASNNPISGLTLSSLLIAGVLMVVLGLTDVRGVAAVLAVAGVVCCAAAIAGEMMQDLKVGHILGGTPWRMQVAEIVGVVAASLVLTLPLVALHRVYTIGSPALPAPQAGLMALMAKGIVGGEMAWPLVVAGIFLAVGLILIKSPSPMLIAVGMYLPFESTAPIFVGGALRWMLGKRLARAGASADERTRAENTGTLLSSGFIAGESLMAVMLAFLVLGAERFPGVEAARQAITAGVEPNPWLGLLIYPALLYLLVWLPVKKMRAAAGGGD